MQNYKLIILSLTMLIVLGIQSIHTQTLFAVEEARFQAQVQMDTLALKELLGDDLLYIHSNGLIETKEDFIESVSSGKITYQEMKPIGKHSSYRRGRMGLVSGTLWVRGLYKGKNFELQLLYTSVYEKIKRKWQLIRWQSTKLEN